MAEIILPPEENEETPQAPQTPELNIDKPTSNSKVITIEFEAKKTNKVSTKDTNQQLYTTDTDAWFEFKETSLESANGTYSVVFRNRHDGSIFQRTGDVAGGVAYYKIPHQEIRHAGAWRGQLVYTLENGNTTAREFDYDVKGHILGGKDVREIVVEDFETLMSQLRSMKENAEVELSDLTQELKNTTDTAEQNETDRKAFFDDLVEDIDELQANYQELLETGVLQTNINNKLEQLEEEYAPKLTEVTAQLAQTVDEVNRAASELTHDSEVILARGSGVKGKEFESLDERLEENEEDLAQYKIEYTEDKGTFQAKLDSKSNKSMLLSPKYDLVYDSCVRDVDTPLDAYSVPMESGHYFENVEDRDSDTILTYESDGFLLATPASRHDFSPVLITGLDVDFPYFDVRAKHLRLAQDSRYWFIKYKDKENWVGIRTSGHYQEIRVISTVEGIQTDIAMEEVGGSTGDGQAHPGTIYSLKAEIIRVHRNFTVSVRALRVFKNKQWVFTVPIPTNSVDFPNRTGFSVGSETEILNFKSGRSS